MRKEIGVEEMKYKWKEKYNVARKRWKDSHKAEGTYNRGNRTAQTQRYTKKNSQKVKAEQMLNKAVNTGKIIKPVTCPICENSGEEYIITGHHEDYTKPLNVDWMCCYCHNSLHLQEVK